MSVEGERSGIYAKKRRGQAVLQNSCGGSRLRIGVCNSKASTVRHSHVTSSKRHPQPFRSLWLSVHGLWRQVHWLRLFLHKDLPLTLTAVCLVSLFSPLQSTDAAKHELLRKMVQSHVPCCNGPKSQICGKASFGLCGQLWACVQAYITFHARH